MSSEQSGHLPAEHVVAFIDILGFKNLIRRMAVEPSTYNAVFGVLTRVSGEQELHRKAALARAGDATLIPSQFSDSIVISCPVEKATEGEAVTMVLRQAAYIAGEFLLFGILTRGGVARGWTYHKGSVLFGEGVLAAYELESAKARMPRVLLAEDVALSLTDRQKDFVVCDTDGFWFVDPFYDLTMTNPEGDVVPDPQLFREMGARITNAMKLAESHSPGIREKYHWLARQFNEGVRRRRPWYGFDADELETP
jgi:hypothetical protein